MSDTELVGRLQIRKGKLEAQLAEVSGQGADGSAPTTVAAERVVELYREHGSSERQWNSEVADEIYELQAQIRLNELNTERILVERQISAINVELEHKEWLARLDRFKHFIQSDLDLLKRSRSERARLLMMHRIFGSGDGERIDDLSARINSLVSDLSESVENNFGAEATKANGLVQWYGIV